MDTPIAAAIHTIEENFENKMKRLTEELNFCFKENRKLEKTIKEKLESIGYGL